MRWKNTPPKRIFWILTAIVLIVFGIVYERTRNGYMLLAGAALLVAAWFLFAKSTSPLTGPFPEAWRAILRASVPFYGKLKPDQQVEFEQGVQVFLNRAAFHSPEGAPIDDELKVLVAATAVMLVFNRPALDLPPVRHIVIKPGAFKMEGVDAAGLLMDKRTMGLSLEDFYLSLNRSWDGYNVIAHEFAHALDGLDGSVDGIPALLPEDMIRPWCDLVKRERERIRAGDSLLRDYADSNEAEFFAVAVEHYLEQPERMKARHPELHDFLHRYLGGAAAFGPIQLAHRLSKATTIGRNDPCPCGSGKKFKKCCI
jgi:hypothetical protein